jgi:Tol biopolymer transport system component
MIAVAALILLAGLGWLIYKRSRANTPLLPVQRSLTRLTFDEGLQTGATWSPDGRYIAYSSDRGGKFDIWVQQVSGGNPVQITRGPGQNWEPDWSPDGKYIAYRSEDGDGGIFIIPALGGEGLERKIASFGYYPQWSPDSSQVLLQPDFTAFGSNQFYLAQLDGTPPREILAEFIAEKKLWVPSAAWHPDGKRITIWAGESSPNPRFSPSPSFWTVPISGGPGTRMEIAPAVQRELARASGQVAAGEQLGDYSFSWSPSGNAVYFERGFGGARNIWKLTVSPETLQATGIDRLTTGPGPDVGHAVSPDGKRLAFTATSHRMQTWLFPFDARTGQLTGAGRAISAPGRMSVDPTLSRDGTKVAYLVPHGTSSRGDGDVQNEVWLKSLVDGSEVPLFTGDGYSRWLMQWSPDGKQLVYQRRKFGTNQHQIVVWSSESHEERPLTALDETLGVPFDWSQDGKWLLTDGASGIWLVPIAAAPHAETAAKKIISNPAYAIFQPHFSPDGRWIVFEAVPNLPNTKSVLYVAPVSGDPWIRITDGSHWVDKPRWSPDGKTIYFVAQHGGFFNLWGIHFDPAAGKPIREPFQVSKFDSARLMIPRFIPPVGLSLTQDKLVLTMEEESGNIWVLDNVDR